MQGKARSLTAEGLSSSSTGATGIATGCRDGAKTWSLKVQCQPQPSSVYDAGKLSTLALQPELGSPAFSTALCRFVDYIGVFFPTHQMVKLRFREFPCPCEAEAGLHSRSSIL